VYNRGEAGMTGFKTWSAQRKVPQAAWKEVHDLEEIGRTYVMLELIDD
jgi:hypothetical protein